MSKTHLQENGYLMTIDSLLYHIKGEKIWQQDYEKFFDGQASVDSAVFSVSLSTLSHNMPHG